MMSAPRSRKAVERRRAVLGDLDLVGLPAQQVGERVGEIRLVLDDQDAGHAVSPFVGTARGAGAAVGALLRALRLGVGWSAGGSVCGRRIVKVEPRPGRDHSRTSPPWRCTACLTIDSPRPGAAGATRPRLVGAVEALEHAVLVALGDADAAVGDGDLDDAVDELHPDADARPLGEYAIALAMRLPTASLEHLRVAAHVEPARRRRARPRPRPSPPGSRARRPPRRRPRRRRRSRSSVSSSAACRRERFMMREVSSASRDASAVSRAAKMRTCGGSSAADSIASASRLTAPTGVFSSWLVFATKSRRICSTRSRSVMSRMTSRVSRGEIRVARTTTRRGSAGGAPRRRRRVDVAAAVGAAHAPRDRAQLVGRKRGALARARTAAPPRTRRGP